ncbi:MAG: sugar nucleotide-binding protein, partial [Eudoraea sp.]|nr:sugar nucleotide-binding protein [Eudoraea sp.]
MKKVLVTGAEGQLGKCLQHIAAQYPQLKSYFFDSNALDITDVRQLQLVFEKTGFDFCINAAAYTNVEA